eukprot:IDg21831t1
MKNDVDVEPPIVIDERDLRDQSDSSSNSSSEDYEDDEFEDSSLNKSDSEKDPMPRKDVAKKLSPEKNSSVEPQSKKGGSSSTLVDGKRRSLRLGARRVSQWQK